MAIGNIEAGTTGTFAAQLEVNGAVIALPSGSVFTWSASDPSVTIDTSGSPDGSLAVVTVPAGDQGTSVDITAATVAGDGSSVSGSITVDLTPIPQVFTVTITQTA